MKFILVFLSLHLLHLISFSQPSDTIRVYTHTNEKEHWSITTKNKLQYTLFSVDSNSMEDITLSTFKFSDTAIRFVFDTSKLQNKNLIDQNYAGNSEIYRILNGKFFGLFGNYILPLDENILANDNGSSKTIYKSYFLGDGYGNTTIELKPANQYTIYSRSCLNGASESGKWTRSDNIITFVPNDDNHKILGWFASDRKFVFTGKYLISKNVGEPENIARLNSITETYFYFAANSE